MSSEGHLALAGLSGRGRRHRRWWLIVSVAAIAILPLVLQDSYWRTNLIVCALNVMLAIGLDFILGYAGQLNLGHSAFYGIGAYASTLLIIKLGVPFWIAFAAGMALSGAAGMALSLFAVRLRGHYLAIASLGFAVIVHQVLLNWISLTQGPLGIYAIKPPPDIALPGLPVISFGNTANMFYLVASFAFLFYLLLDQLVRSPIGQTLAAIREDEISAASFGINCTTWKVFAFGIGSAVAGAAGAFYASFVGTLVPDAFSILESFTILAMVIVGGIFAIIGPNGAGKSTLLNLMSGLYQPDAGSMTFDGSALVGLPAHKRARLGLARTFQKIRLFRQLTVLGNVVAAFHRHRDIPAWQ